MGEQQSNSTYLNTCSTTSFNQKFPLKDVVPLGSIIYLELRAELEAVNPNVVFTTDSDCEVMLHLYKHHGPEFLSKVIAGLQQTVDLLSQ